MESKTLTLDTSFDFIEENIDKYEICEICIDRSLVNPPARIVYEYDSRRVKLFISDTYYVIKPDFTLNIDEQRLNNFLKIVIAHVRGTLTLDEKLSEKPVVIKSIADNEKIKNIVIGGDGKATLYKSFYDGLKDCKHIKHIDSKTLEVSLLTIDNPRIVFNLCKYDYIGKSSDKKFICLDDILGKVNDSGNSVIDIYDEDVDSLSNNGYKDILNFNPKTSFNVTACSPSNVCKFSKALLDNNLKNKVIINVNTLSGKELAYFLAQAYYKDYSNIYINYLRNNFKVKRFIEEENILYSMVREAMELSPFEKYIFAYGVVTTFKKYKDFSKKAKSSFDYWGRLTRHPYYILHNDFIVCTGYELLREELMFKLGIKATSFSNFSTIENEEITGNNRWHYRGISYIKDDKYEIDGMYFSDPTFDAQEDKKYFVFSALTAEEYDNMKRYNGLKCNKSFEVLFAEFMYSSIDINDFYNKINFVIGRFFSNYANAETATMVIDLVKPFDNELHKRLYDEINSINCFDSFEFNTFFKKAVEEVGEFITSKNNNPISGENIMKALKNICLKLRPDEYDEEVLDDIREENIEWYSLNFPERVKEYSDGHKEYINSKNKFRA